MAIDHSQVSLGQTRICIVKRSRNFEYKYMKFPQSYSLFDVSFSPPPLLGKFHKSTDDVRFDSKPIFFDEPVRTTSPRVKRSARKKKRCGFLQIKANIAEHRCTRAYIAEKKKEKNHRS